jgi:hypothetical protein
MTDLTIHLMEPDYFRLEQMAEHEGKSVNALIQDWIEKLLDIAEPFDVTQDPIFQMDGYDSNAPVDLSMNVDKYLYGEKFIK